MQNVLNKMCYPKNPSSFSYCLKQRLVREIDYYGAMIDKETILIPCSDIRRYEQISGKVLRMYSFPDGEVVILKPDRGCVYNCKSWKELVLWIPAEGNVGILWFWKFLKENKERLFRRSFMLLFLYETILLSIQAFFSCAWISAVR